MSKPRNTHHTSNGGPMDPVTAAYVQHHDLAFILQTMDRVLRDVEETFAARAPSSTPSSAAHAKSSSSPVTSQESAAVAVSSPLSEKEDESFQVTDLANANTLKVSLMLQLLLSSFTPLSTTSAAASGSSSRGGGTKQHSSPPSPAPFPLSETANDAVEKNANGIAAGVGAEAEPSGTSPSSLLPPVNAMPWPAAVSFATKNAAVKAEVCRCFAQWCECLRSGVGLVDSCGPSLRWSELCPTLGGHERLAVAFVFDVFRCWRSIVVPLLRATGDLTVSSETALAQDAAEAFFDALVVAPASKQPQRVLAANSTNVDQRNTEAVCSYWCLIFLQGYCRDFPVDLWTSIVRVAQDAAAAQQECDSTISGSTFSSSESVEPELPRLTSETLLLRSFLAHIACPADESPKLPSSVKSVAEAYVPEAVAAAKLRSPAWAWAEVTGMQTLLQHHSGSVSTDDVTMLALLCADGYWAAFLQPYTAMCAQYYL